MAANQEILAPPHWAITGKLILSVASTNALQIGIFPAIYVCLYHTMHMLINNCKLTGTGGKQGQLAVSEYIVSA